MPPHLDSSKRSTLPAAVQFGQLKLNLAATDNSYSVENFPKFIYKRCTQNQFDKMSTFNFILKINIYLNRRNLTDVHVFCHVEREVVLFKAVRILFVLIRGISKTFLFIFLSRLSI